MKPRHLLAFLSLVGVPAWLAAPPAQAAAGVNWVDGYVSAIGRGTANVTDVKELDEEDAKLAARTIAEAELLEKIKGVKVDATTVVEDMIIKNQTVRTRISGMLRGVQVVREEVKWVNGKPLATVEVRVCLSNRAPGCRALASVIGALPQASSPAKAPVVESPKPLPKAKPRTKPKARPTPKPKPAAAPARAGLKRLGNPDKPVSGLVLDLRGLPYQRHLLPVVLAPGEDGGLEVVYSVKFVDPKMIRDHAVARDTDTVAQALRIKRLGREVLVVPVRQITGAQEIVISRADFRTIKNSLRFGNDYFKQGKVAIALKS